jgi:hypothetical protein
MTLVTGGGDDIAKLWRLTELPKAPMQTQTAFSVEQIADLGVRRGPPLRSLSRSPAPCQRVTVIRWSVSRFPSTVRSWPPEVWTGSSKFGTPGLENSFAHWRCVPVSMIDCVDNRRSHACGRVPAMWNGSRGTRRGMCCWLDRRTAQCGCGWRRVALACR